MDLYDEIREIYKEYLIYLQKNPRVILPEHIHDPSQSIGKVHASALGRCPLASAKKREGVEPASMESMSTLHLMQQGVRDAEPLQEALYWKYPDLVQIEFSVEREMLRGRLDILYGTNVIEIKRRDGYMRNPPQPKLTDVYQMIAYSYMTGFKNINLCLMTRFNLNFWKLIEEGNGFKLVDEEGNDWKNGYNNPGYLSYSVLLYEANRHMDYLNGEKSEDPMPNFLNIPGGAECFHWENNERPKQYKTSYNGESQRTANIIPHCPFWCHGGTPAGNPIPVEEIEYGTKEYRLSSV